MRLRWSEKARGEYRAQIAFIAERNYSAARKIQEKISASTDLLILHPEIGKAGRREGTRELWVSGAPFIIVYSLSRDDIVILSILSTYIDYH